jgi:ribosomal protein L9
MTDADKILEHLKQGKTLTFLEAVNLFGTVSVRERLKDLRKQGFEIKTTMVTNPTTKRRHAVYSLQQPTTVEEIYART